MRQIWSGFISLEYVDYEDAPHHILAFSGGGYLEGQCTRAGTLSCQCSSRRTVTTHGAARNGLINGQLQPNSFVRLGRETSATNDLFLGLMTCKCLFHHDDSTYHALNLDGVLHGARTRGIQWRHVEHINTLETTHQFETLQTSALALVGTHGTRLRTLTLDDRGVVLREAQGRSGDRAHSHTLDRGSAQRSAERRCNAAAEERPLS